MNNFQEIEYSFLRADKNNDIIIFLKVEPMWLDRELGIDLVDKSLVVTLLNDKDIQFKTKELEPILIDQLTYKPTPIVFSDNEGVFLAEMLLEPKLNILLNQKTG